MSDSRRHRDEDDSEIQTDYEEHPRRSRSRSRDAADTHQEIDGNDSNADINGNQGELQPTEESVEVACAGTIYVANLNYKVGQQFITNHKGMFITFTNIQWLVLI